MRKKHRKIPAVLLATALAVLFILAMLLSGRYFLDKKLPEIVEELNAKHETINILKPQKEKPEKIHPETISEIEKRISQEEMEFNKAKMEEMLKREQYDVLAFENALISVERPVNELIAKQEVILNQWQSKKTEPSHAYGATALAKEQCERAKKDLRFIRVPETLNREVTELLQKTKSDLISAYEHKTEALDELLRFIKEKKIESQDNFNEAIKLARQDMSNAALNIIEAKKKLRINIETANPADPADVSSNPENCNFVVNGIYYLANNPYVFLNAKIYRINDQICTGKISNILQNKVTITFPDGSRDYAVGEKITNQ